MFTNKTFIGPWIAAFCLAASAFCQDYVEVSVPPRAGDVFPRGINASGAITPAPLRGSLSDLFAHPTEPLLRSTPILRSRRVTRPTRNNNGALPVAHGRAMGAMSSLQA